jgi:glycosyltransferase involved in cell wall biosynthesis
MRKVLIVSEQKDYKFPLAEANRKQIFEEAKLEGQNCEILIITKKGGPDFVVKGIKISFVERIGLIKKILYLRSFNRIRYIGNIGISSILVGFFAAFKENSMNITDGGIFSTVHRVKLLCLLAKVTPFLYREFNIYTHHQLKILIGISSKYKNKLNIIMPILDRDVHFQNTSKGKSPTILYMSHISEFKGFDTVLYIYENLKKKLPDLKLIVADNGVMSDKVLLEKLHSYKTQYKDDIILKTKVDPYKELSQCSLYIYLFKKENGTFAFPLSLYESLLCGTPFLGPKLEGVNEFFDAFFLSNPINKNECLRAARRLLIEEENLDKVIAKNLKSLQDRVLA